MQQLEDHQTEMNRDIHKIDNMDDSEGTEATNEDENGLADELERS